MTDDFTFWLGEAGEPIDLAINPELVEDWTEPHDIQVDE